MYIKRDSLKGERRRSDGGDWEPFSFHKDDQGKKSSSLYLGFNKRLLHETLQIKIHVCTCLVSYESIDHFVIKAHTNTVTKTFSNRKLRRPTHFSFPLTGVVVSTGSSLGDSRTYLVFPSLSRLNERDEFDSVGNRELEFVTERTKNAEVRN